MEHYSDYFYTVFKSPSTVFLLFQYIILHQVLIYQSPPPSYFADLHIRFNNITN